MSHALQFWAVDAKAGEPDLWVCMSCLSEVYRRKVPMPHCPACHGVSTFEAFTLDAIRDWGTDELIAKADAAAAERELEPLQAAGPSEVHAAE